MKVFVILRLALLAGFLGAALPLPAAAITYQYDLQGRLTVVTYDNGTILEYAYDNAGNRKTKIVTPGATTEVPTPREITRTLPSPTTQPGPALPGTAAPAGSSPVVNLPSGIGAPGPLVREVLPGPPALLEEPSSWLQPDLGPTLPEPPSAPQYAAREEDRESTGSSPSQDDSADASGALRPPEKLGVVATNGQVVLLWHRAGDQKTGFIVQRMEGAASGKFAEIARIAAPSGPSAVQWMDTTAESGKVYHYRVAAYDAEGTSSFTAPLEVKVE